MAKLSNNQSEAANVKGDTMLTAMTLTAGKKLLENVVTDLYNSSKGAARSKLKTWTTQSKINTLYKKISAVRNVKTIWQIDKAIDLTKFYYPTRIDIGGTVSELTSIDQFPKDSQAIIEGIVGQGKSVVLRYLCAAELQRGRLLPVFAELRRLEPDQTLVSFICNQIKSLGVKIDEALFSELASKGKIALFLDAFDEVDEELRGKLISELDSLSEEFEELRIIITSRPNNGIQASANFQVHKLEPLDPKATEAMILKLMDGDSLSKDLITAMKKSPTQIVELLTTPLMVTLLVLSYKAIHRIPEELSEFYEELFDVLLSRHDHSKPGFVRKRKCKFNDREMKDVFDALCYLLRKSTTQILTPEYVYDETKKAIQLCSKVEDPFKYLQDIKKITCLLLEEGKKLYFIHKSVSEFHSARFIKTRPEKVKAVFYQHASQKQFRHWQQELRFLSQIDQYSYTKLFLIPECNRVLGEDIETNSKSWRNSAISRVREYADTLTLNIFRRKETGRLKVTSISSATGWDRHYIFLSIEPPLVELGFREVPENTLSAQQHRDVETISQGEALRRDVKPIKLLFSELAAADRELERHFLLLANQFIDRVKKMREDAVRFVADTDASIEVFKDLEEVG